VDDKGRLAVPTAYRDLVARECGNRLVITYNPFEAGSLYLYPEQVWQRVRDDVNKLPSTQLAHRNLQLKLVGAASPVESASSTATASARSPSTPHSVSAPAPSAPSSWSTATTPA
jgi:DNA-binding transcriptional regulator/RsmH inhibitor MraZ